MNLSAIIKNERFNVSLIDIASILFGLLGVSTLFGLKLYPLLFSKLSPFESVLSIFLYVILFFTILFILLNQLNKKLKFFKLINSYSAIENNLIIRNFLNQNKISYSTNSNNDYIIFIREKTTNSFPIRTSNDIYIICLNNSILINYRPSDGLIVLRRKSTYVQLLMQYLGINNQDTIFSNLASQRNSQQINIKLSNPNKNEEL